ncbi:MAG: protein kinase domain-containing protein [Planctomycetaceae bacterium]
MTDSQTRLDQLIAELLLRLERGEQVSLEDFLARHPAEALELHRFVQDLSLLNGRPAGLTDCDATLIDPAGVAALSVSESAAGGVVLQAVPAIGHVFDRYELLGSPLGTGGMGVVYRARLLGTGVQVALKQLRRTEATEQRMFLAEIEAAAGLRHPHIVPVYHAGETDGLLWYTMALISGGSLAERRDLFGCAAGVVVELMLKVIRAVHFAHQRRVLHRDLKPSNILLDEDGEPHVADFGLAVRLSEAGGVATDHPTAGSLPWLAPEIVELSRLSPSERRQRSEAVLTTAVDVWSLGVVLYELLTGERPFGGTTYRELSGAILSGELRRPGLIRADIPRDLEAICLQCLQREPGQRYESAAALAQDLERWQRDEPVRARRTGPAERLLQSCRRAPAMAAVSVAMLVLLLVMTAGYVGTVLRLRPTVLRSMQDQTDYLSRHLAGLVKEKLRSYANRVSERAELLRTIPQGEPVSAADGQRIQQWLDQLVTGPQAFQNAFLLDGEGRILWSSRGFEPPSDGRYSERDYFDYWKNHQAEGGDVYVGRVYESSVDKFDKLPFSMRIPRGGEEFWVFSASILTDADLDLETGSLSAGGNTVCLVAEPDLSADPDGRYAGGVGVHVIFVHPRLQPGDRSVVVELPVNAEAAVDAGKAPFLPMTEYRDPLQSGKWVVGSARVPGTGISILVQRNQDTDLLWIEGSAVRLLLWVLASPVSGVLVWVFLRRWHQWRRSRIC